MALIHGGDRLSYLRTYQREPLDFSANVSPLGMPEAVRQAAERSLSQADQYPDPLCRELKKAISDHYHQPVEHIFCGNGAADLIYRLCWSLRPRHGLVLAPTFAEYELALISCGARVHRFFLTPENDFQPDESLLEAVKGMEILFLCRPNNPTGQIIPLDALRRILLRCRQEGCLVVVDECFMELTDHPERQSILPELMEHPNLILINAFTKVYGMAGLRLGFGFTASPKVHQGVEGMGQPWSVSIPAQAAGIAALQQQDYVKKLRALIADQRSLLLRGLRELGLKVIDGRANYLLFQCGIELRKPLERRGILIRSCGNYPGLDESWYRIAVRTERENQILLRAFKEVIQCRPL